jgi:hypothetical protein
MLLLDVTMKERYGRRRGARPTGSVSFDEQGREIKGPRAELDFRDAVQEAWETVGKAPWSFKKGSVALREKQAARRSHAGHYAPLRAEDTDTSVPAAVGAASTATSSSTTSPSADSTFIVISPGGGTSNSGADEEQIGCIGVESISAGSSPSATLYGASTTSNGSGWNPAVVFDASSTDKQA